MDFGRQLLRNKLYLIGNVTVEAITLMPLGNCVEIKNYPDVLYFNTKQLLALYFVDPYRQTFYRYEWNTMTTAGISNKFRIAI